MSVRSEDKKNELLIRVYVLLLAFGLFACLILFRVVKISLIEGDKWRSKAESKVEWKTVDSERGNIFDAQGNILATSLPFFDIRMDLLAPTDEVFNAGVDSLSYWLAKDFPDVYTEQQWRFKLTNDRRLGKERKKSVRYTALVSDINLDQLDRLKSYPILRKGKYRGGLIVVRKNKRFKPFAGLASRTIGEDRENADKIGLEAAYDKVLSGPAYEVFMKKVSGGVWVPMFDPAELKIEKGDDVVTTLDMTMQDLVHQELELAVLNNKARAGTAILMDVESGGIKAMANLTNTKKGAVEDFNYAIGRLSEPGSTFKIASYLAMLDDGHLQLNEKVNLNGGKKRFYDLTMKDSHLHGKFEVTAAEAFKMSSNIGAADLALKYYGKRAHNARFVNKLDSFGLVSKTNIELPGEPNPVIKHPDVNKKTWYGTTIPWMSHGYELMLTPLQMLNFCNAIANGGRLMEPYMVSELIRNGKTWEQFSQKVLIDQIASKGAIEQMHDLLKSTVNDGTAKSVKSDIVEIAGKTGTTRVNYAQAEEEKKYNASFVGFFPADSPKYSLLVVVYEPKDGDYYGGKVAGPVFKNIAEGVTLIDEKLMASIVNEERQDLVKSYHAGYAGDYEKVLEFIGVKDVQTRNKWIDIFPKEDELKVERKKIKVGKIPDLKGMGLRDAIYIMESLGVKYEVFGSGRVWKQTIDPGKEIDQNTLIIYLQ